MALFMAPVEVLTELQAGVQSRHGGFITSKIVAPVAGIDAGLFVGISGTNDVACDNITTAALAQNAIGVTLFESMKEDFDATHHYGPNDVAAVLVRGHVGVLAEQTVVAGKPVYARILSDAGSNTVVGKVRANSDLPAGGLVITPDASFAAVVSSFQVVLSDGATTESFIFTSDATPITAEVTAGLAALIDASVTFIATSNATTISITSTTNTVEVVSIDERLPVTTIGRAIRIPGAYFANSRTGAGLVEISVGGVSGKA